ncbi:response regulator FixJ [Rhizorhapis suberifaciens]|uniref:Two-component system response regulator FixJ n=1 Tax=Rhizorhapis suberifaciens TaxID=13656 RepID=A0A840HX00_9SPHN|nr:response regulator FixJ [Rhizorhapis suberifaciens]MBB4641934.1 two-component system response regulator FixJ [Rhizorhapis suberifaciens]
MTDKLLVHVVDDDEAIRRSISFLLRTSGYTVSLYASGRELLMNAARLERGCILLDVRMPEIDGMEVQQQLRQSGIMLPVIIMTGHGDVDMAVRAMKAGASDFIEKPFERAALLDALEAARQRLEVDKLSDRRCEDARNRLNILTPRERDVLKGMVDGLPNKTIAYDLGISPRTVEIHRANLMQKLEVQSLSEALRIAFTARLFEEPGEGSAAVGDGG